VNVPIITKRLQAQRAAIETEAMTKAVAAVTDALQWGGVDKSFLAGNAALGNTGMSNSATMLSAASNTGKPPGTSWSNQQGGMQAALIARVTQNLASGFARAPEDLELALAEQGLSWGPPFPPGRPLDPFYGYRRPPRTWDYSVGENVQITPRQKRISFETIESIWDTYDVAQICTKHLINDVRSLDYAWEPPPGCKDDVSEDIAAAEAFWDSPDKRQPFRAWLAEYLEDVIKFDAGSLYIRRNNAGEPIALEVVSGTTILPLVDFYGRRPEDEDDEEPPEDLFDGEIVPAYAQIIEGLPWVWLAADDLIYQLWNPQPKSQYGRAPLEAVLISANTDIRFQWHFLQFFTEGSVPEGYMEAPPDQSDPTQIAHWQEVWDAVMSGDQSMKRKIRWVPNGTKFTESKPSASKFDSEFPLYLMRRTCAAHGITPNDLGFTENVNKSSGDTQIDVQFRVGTAPLLRHCEDVINLFTKQYLKLRCRLKFDDGRETEDRVATATAEGIYIDHGVISPDEPRQRLGYPIDKSRPMSRFINNARTGPIPLLALESMSGEVDAETYGPSDQQKLVNTPFAAPAGVIPPQGTPEQIAAAETTAQQARDLIESTSGEKPPTDPSASPPATSKPTDQEAVDETEPKQGDEEHKGQSTAKKGVNSGMVSLDLPLGSVGSEPDPHITVVFLGSDVADETFAEVCSRARGVAAVMQPLEGKVSGLDTFPPSDGSDHKTPVFAIPDVPELDTLRAAFEDFNASEHADFTPHVTLTYLDEGDPMPDPVPETPITFGGLSVHRGDETMWYPFGGGEPISKGVDNTGGPGVTRSFSNPTTITGGTDGITVPLGEDDDEDEDEIKKAYVDLALRRWRKSSRNRLRSGRAPRKFVDPNLPQDVHDAVWAQLGKARTREEVDAAFKATPKKASAGSRPAFHRNAQVIVDHYTPLLHKAIAGMFSDGSIDAAISAADKAKPAEKMSLLQKAVVWDKSTCDLSLSEQAYTQGSSGQVTNNATREHKDPDNEPQKPVAVGSLSVRVQSQQAEYDDGAKGHQHYECNVDGGPHVKSVAKDIDPEILAARDAAAKALAGKAASTDEALKVLEALYGDAFLQGAHEAAHAASASIVTSLQGVSDMPEDYWSKWTPGYGEAAAKAADGGMREMLDKIGITIQGMTDTTIDDIGNTIADGLAKGDSYEATGKAVREMIGEVNRSEMIANTEYARASTEASMETYRQNDVEKKEFMAEPDACPECQENEDAGVIPLEDEFPNGDVPVHPNCRCAIAPVVE